MSVFNSWQGVKSTTSSDKTTVHAAYKQGENPLLAATLSSMMAISPHFEKRLAEEAVSTVKNHM